VPPAFLALLFFTECVRGIKGDILVPLEKPGGGLLVCGGVLCEGGVDGRPVGNPIFLALGFAAPLARIIRPLESIRIL